VKKIAQNAAQLIFCQNLNTTFTLEKSSSKVRASSVIFEKLPNVNTNAQQAKIANSGHPGWL
jgi:hypothetical protein